MHIQMETFASSFPIYHLLFLFLIGLAAISGTVLNISGESRHFCFIPDLKIKALTISLLVVTLPVDFSKMSFVDWGSFLMFLLDRKLLTRVCVEFCQIVFLHLCIVVYSFNMMNYMG